MLIYSLFFVLGIFCCHSVLQSISKGTDNREEDDSYIFLGDVADVCG